MYWIISYTKKSWWHGRQELYLNKDLMEVLPNRDMASVFDDVVEADRLAARWRDELLDKTWRRQIIPID